MYGGNNMKRKFTSITYRQGAYVYVSNGDLRQR